MNLSGVASVVFEVDDYLHNMSYNVFCPEEAVNSSSAFFLASFSLILNQFFAFILLSF